MNVLFVSTDYPKKGQPTTGFPNYLYRVSLSLIALGHRPIILAAGDRDSHRIEQGIEIQTVMASPSFEVGLQAVDYALYALQIGHFLNQKIRDITHKTHIDIIQFTSLCGIAIFYYGNIPSVLRLSSYAKTYFSTFQTFSKAKVMTMSFFERMSARRCNVVFAPCKNTADAFSKDCHRKVGVIETPFVNDVQKYDTKYYDDCLKGKKYVLFFGTLYSEKGILVIADILEKFLLDNPDYYFAFIGKAEKINGESAFRILRRMAGKCVDRVILLNAMPHKGLYPIIQHADFVVLPSFMDNMPNACIEAMYFERVVIGTDGASFEQLITHEKNGLLCRIGDSADLLQKMQFAVSMTWEEKIQMGKLAKKRINRLKPEYAVQKLVQLYEYVIENSRHN
ncbi:MAG: glycosyltransferase family 4 protein [Blautia sp.]|nr:glycosyltransferase family 4 protein [Blautia sp.]